MSLWEMFVGKSSAVLFETEFLSGHIATNVLALGAVADFGAQNCQPRTKFDTK
ncbi:MAG: hypothetical protein ACKO96_06550 [Flammeovirgaceae bacterium]